MSIFIHKSADLPNKDFIRISPSSISKFFEYPSVWFLDNLTDEPKSFIGNTSSVLGTCCHHIYELYGRNPKEFIENKDNIYQNLNQELHEYLKSDLQLQTVVDEEIVLDRYPLIAREVVNGYISTTMPTEVEKSVYTQIEGYDIYLAGTIDNITKNIIVDYKTVGTKPNTESIPFNYKIQLLAYWYILDKLGYKMDWIRLVYGVAPTKTMGARCFTVTERISDEDKKLVTDTINLMCESIKRCKEDNSLIPIVFKSMNLVGRTL